MKITESMTLTPNPGFQEYEIDCTEADLHLDLKEACELFVRITKAEKLKITAHVSEGVQASVLFWNDSNETLEAEESYEVEEIGDLTVAYGECNSASTKRKTDVQLLGRGSKAMLSSASLVDSKKEYRMNLENRGIRSIGNIRNYAVVLKNGKLMIDAIGKIDKGAKKAQSHQTSRALAFEEGQNATILPELLIDENDVQASHAMSIGKVDESHLYYMMSRGLDMKQCTMLISEGYLLPITDYISDEKLRSALKDELERKIEESCLM